MIKRYFQEAFASDLKAGFITAIVALPLAIAFAIASGVPPIMGLYTAIIAGILGSGLGGSRFSITGPTGAMTVIILSTVQKFGIEGLMLAGFLAGLIQIGFGLIRLGKFVKYIPFPIISGFTAGIGVIIFLGQVGNALGLTLGAKEHVWETVWEIIKHFSEVQLLSVGIALLTILCLIFLPTLFSRYPRLRNIPPSLIPLLLSTAAVIVLGLSIPQVGSIPRGLPEFHFLKISLGLVHVVLPAAFTIALLGVIEALLCAVVCDGMTNTKHNSDRELIGQGVCNTILPFFGGIPSTAAIARSAVNIREGAKTKMAGIFHGLFLLITLLLAAPIAQYIPKAFLAGVLMVVSIKMINLHEFKTILKLSQADAIVLFITLGFTVFTDLVLAVEVGMVLAIFLLFIRLSNIIDVSSMKDYGAGAGLNTLVYQHPKLKEAVGIYTIHGPFFFGAMSMFEQKIKEHLDVAKPIMILRLKYVSFIDSTGVIRLHDFIEERQKEGTVVLLAEVPPPVRKVLEKDQELGAFIRKGLLFRNTQAALSYIEKNLPTLLVGK